MYQRNKTKKAYADVQLYKRFSNRCDNETKRERSRAVSGAQYIGYKTLQLRLSTDIGIDKNVVVVHASVI